MIHYVIEIGLGLGIIGTGTTVFLVWRRVVELINAGDAFMALTGDKRRPQCSRVSCKHGASTPCKSGLCAEHCNRFCAGGSSSLMCDQ